MSSEFIEPNWHIAVVHFPIALLVVGTLIEVTGFLGWRRTGLGAAGRWMILLGAIFGVPVSLSGVYALSDVSQSLLDPAQVEVAKDHLILGSVSTIAALLGSVFWLGCSDRWRRVWYWPTLLVMLGATGAILSAAHHGGELVYRHGVGVTRPSMASTRSAEVNEAAVAGGFRGWSDRVAPFLPPMQLHVFLAGFSISLSVVSLGVASRSMMERTGGTDGRSMHDADSIAAALTAGPLPGGGKKVVELGAPATRAAPVVMLAVLAGVGAALAGAWILAPSPLVDWSIGRLWQEIRGGAEGDGWVTRRLAHLVVGGLIVILPVLVLVVARLMPRSRLILMVLSLAVLCSATAQVWLGSLMMFKTSVGPVTKWVGPADESH